MKTEKIKILHLEDSETDVEHIHRVLTQGEIQFTSRIVDSREDYVAALRDFGPQVVISDHSMPSFNSLEALDILRTSGIDIPFILLTGAVSEEFAAEVMNRGADDYILKDRPKRLPTAILGALDKYEQRHERERQEAELRNIFDGSMDVLCSIDIDGRFIKVSAAAEKTWGYKPAELADKKYMDLICAADHAATLRVAESIMSGLAITNFENRYIHKDGNIIPMIWSARWDPDAQVMYAVARDGTERVNAEKAITTERNRIREMFKNAPVSMCLLKGENHVFEMANLYYKNSIGTHDLIGRSAREVLPEIESQGFFALLDTCYKTGEPYAATELLVKKDRLRTGHPEDMYVNLLFQPIRDSQGLVEGISYFAVHVTEQVLARKKIEESYEKLKSAESLQSSILNSLPAQIALLDSEENIIAVNRTWEDFARENRLNSPTYRVGENYIAASDIAGSSGPNTGAKMARGVRDVIRGVKKSFSLEYRCDSPTEKRWFIARVAPTIYGEERGAVIIHTNTTDRKLAEEKIKESEANLAAIIENADAHIYSLDRDFRYITFNSVIKDSIGSHYGIEIKPGDSVYGFLEKIDPAEAKWWEKVYTEALSGQKMQFVKDYSTPDRPYYLNFSINPILQNGGIIGLACFARDITPIKMVENKITELNENLENRIIERTAQLNDAIKELEAFNYTVSHDLQAPLRVINGFVKIILNEYGDKVDDTGKEYFTYISDNTLKMSQLIKDLLDFARLGEVALHREQADMRPIVDAIVTQARMISPDMDTAITIRELPAALCDPPMIKQVWSNLILNAIKYSNKKKYPKIEIGAEILNARPVYYVRDNGVGFDMDKADKLFGVFKRLHSPQDFEGSGIGLATVHRILAKHGGEIWAEAKINEGATFYFTIPTT